MQVKENFFDMVTQVKSTGIVDALSNATNPQEMRAIWERFSNENAELFQRAKKWAEEEFYNECGGINEFIFKKGDSIDNPLEVILIPLICGGENLCFADLFEDFAQEMIVEPLSKTGNRYTKALVYIIESGIEGLEDATPELIFDNLN